MQCNFQVVCTRPNGLKYLRPCGQCTPCRITAQKRWASRILQEAQFHPESIFVTLTYSDENVPKSLDKRTAQLWLKRYRDQIYPRKIRYFLVGEYGEETGRPHFHAVIFSGRCTDVDIIKNSWSYGFVMVAPMTDARARYVAKYVLKKLGAPPNYSDGRLREFALMSRRPGIGAEFARCTAEAVKRTDITYKRHDPCIPKNASPGTQLLSTWRLSGRKQPITPYVCKKVKAALGVEPAHNAELKMDREARMFEYQLMEDRYRGQRQEEEINRKILGRQKLGLSHRRDVRQKDGSTVK